MPFCHLRLKGSKPPDLAYPNTLKTLGDHLRKKRLDLGLLQRDVAKKLRVAPSTITNWEGNATTPTYQYTKAVLNFLGYNPFPLAKSLAEELVLYRKTQGLSQRQFARRLGVDPSTVAGWETGRHRPTNKFLKTIRSFLQEAEG